MTLMIILDTDGKDEQVANRLASVFRQEGQEVRFTFAGVVVRVIDVAITDDAVPRKLCGMWMADRTSSLGAQLRHCVLPVDHDGFCSPHKPR